MNTLTVTFKNEFRESKAFLIQGNPSQSVVFRAFLPDKRYKSGKKYLSLTNYDRLLLEPAKFKLTGNVREASTFIDGQYLSASTEALFRYVKEKYGIGVVIQEVVRIFD